MATTYYMSGASLVLQYLNNLGLLAAGGALSTFVAGSVNTPVTTYTDSTGTVQNANPMTLSSSARPVAASGAPTAFWVPGGISIKLVVTDSAGNLLVTLDNIPGINDLTNSSTALGVLLASPASSNTAGAGPVAGADLVANAVKSYDVFASVRTANAPVLSVGQTLNILVQGGTAIGDGLGGTFYWSASSGVADDGRNVLKPSTLSAATPGRWIRFQALGVPQIVVAVADQQVISSTVIANDNTLTLPLSTGTWLIDYCMQMLGIGATGQGWKVQASFTGSTTGNTSGSGAQSANGTAAAAASVIGSANTGAAVSSTTGDTLNIRTTLVVTAPGSFNMGFAQNASTANATVRKAGSCLIATRVA